MLILLLLATCALAYTIHPDIFKNTPFTPDHRLVVLSIEYDRLINEYKENSKHEDAMDVAKRMAYVMGHIEWLMFRHNVTKINMTLASVT
jgi:hypothetical protein